MESRHSYQALFRSAGGAGGDWLFVTHSDVGWAIMYNQTEIHAGGRESTAAGVKKFILLTCVVVDSNAVRNTTFLTPLDRIQRKKSASLKTAQLLEPKKPRLTKSVPASFSFYGTAAS